MAGAAQDCAGGRTADEQHSRDQDERTEQPCPGRPDQPAEERFQSIAEISAVCGPEDEGEREGDQDQPRPERPEARQVAVRDHQPPDGDARDRQCVRGAADQGDEAVADRLADVAAVPADVEDGEHEQAEEEQAQADQLGMMMRPDLPPRRPLPDTGRHLRAYLAGTLLARHARDFDARPADPFSAPAPAQPAPPLPARLRRAYGATPAPAPAQPAPPLPARLRRAYGAANARSNTPGVTEPAGIPHSGG